VGKEHIGLDSRAWCLAMIDTPWMDGWSVGWLVWRFMACSDLDMRDSWMDAWIGYRRLRRLVHGYFPDWGFGGWVGLLDI
jgi:hypothetical protein